MEQVYNALASELNHYNPSNPYVYDKKEKWNEQNGKLHELEMFYINRKESHLMVKEILFMGIF